MSLTVEDSTGRMQELSGMAIPAPAKLNLSLHVVGQRADGYHRLDGLVAFAEEGDRLFVSPADETELAIEGPFAADVPREGNLLHRVLAMAEGIASARQVRLGAFHLVLEKNLPAAAGIGGGSADAAAFLRHLGRLHPILADDFQARASSLGADVPMCLDGRPARITGIGDEIEPLTAFPALPLVLVNPGVAVATPGVFRALASRANPAPPPVPAAWFPDPRALAVYLRACRNDLEEPATRIAPVIAEVLRLLRQTAPLLARMSGSGATVFALYETQDHAKEAARVIEQAHPHWWVRASSTKGFVA